MRARVRLAGALARQTRPQFLKAVGDELFAVTADDFEVAEQVRLLASLPDLALAPSGSKGGLVRWSRVAPLPSAGRSTHWITCHVGWCSRARRRRPWVLFLRRPQVSASTTRPFCKDVLQWRP